MDSQIKHMGHRIELGEIEAVISANPYIRRCCCLYENKTQRIVIIYEGDCERNSLVEYIKTKVPMYMIPNVYINVPEMPVNLNGKIDRVLLKKLYLKENE